MTNHMNRRRKAVEINNRVGIECRLSDLLNAGITEVYTERSLGNLIAN